MEVAYIQCCFRLTTLRNYSALDVEFYFDIRFAELIVCVTRVKIVAKNLIALQGRFELAFWAFIKSDHLSECFMRLCCFEGVSGDDDASKHLASTFFLSVRLSSSFRTVFE